MKFFSQTLTVLFSLAVLIALSVGGYFALEYLVGIFAKIDFQVAVVTAVASVVALMAAWIIASSLSEASRQIKGQSAHAEKTTTYQQLIAAWKEELQHEGGQGLKSSDLRSDNLEALECLLVLHGSPGVVDAYGALRALATSLSPQRSELVSQFTAVLLEMRKDLGLSVQNLKAADLLQLLFNHETAAPEFGATQQPQDLHPRVSLAAVRRKDLHVP